MPCVLTVIHSKDARDSADFVRNHQIHCDESIDLVCLDDLQFPLKPSRIQNLARSKLFVVLISPSLLKFLQEQSENAFSVCRLIKPASTTVIFCNNAQETDVTSQHKSALSSFELWSKTLPGEMLQKKKCLQLMSQPMSQMSIDLNVDTLIVPSKATSEQNCIYAIFDKPVAELDNLTIVLERNTMTEVKWTKINPYVASFIISDDYFQSSENIKVQIRHLGKIIDMKDLLCEEDQTVLYSDVICASPRTPTSSSISEKSAVNAANTSSLLELCAKYGLEQYAAGLIEDKLLDEQGLKDVQSLQNGDESSSFETSTEENDIKPQSENPYLEVTLLNDDADWSDTSSFKSMSLRRSNLNFQKSTSLPSVYSPEDQTDPFRNYCMDETNDTCYVDMSANPKLRHSNLKPHERLLQEARHKESCPYEDIDMESLLSNHIYISLKLDDKTSETPHQVSDLSKSQQELVELLHAFKRGVKTISEVERLFQDWHFKHRRSLNDQASMMQQKYGKVQKRQQSFKLMPDFKNILSKPKRKESKDYPTDQVRRQVNHKEAERMAEKRHMQTLSKASNSSSSSHCSIISEHSGTVGSYNGLTTDSGTHSDGTDSGRRGRTIKKSDDPSTNWFATTFEKTGGPLFPFDDPPPPCIPPRPPPLPARRKIPIVTEFETKQKPKVMPRRKLLRQYRSPSPDYITPNEHKPLPPRILQKKGFSKSPKKPTLLFPLPAWKYEYRKENAMMISSPQRKISAPDFRNQKQPPSFDIGDQMLADLKDTKLIVKDHRLNRFAMRKSSSYPQLRESISPQPIYTRMLNQVQYY